MKQPPSRRAAPGKYVPPGEIQELEGLLHATQQLLAAMSSEAQRDSWQYKEISLRHESLTARLQAVRQQQAASAVPASTRGPYAGPVRPAAALPRRPDASGSPAPALPVAPPGAAGAAYGHQPAAAAPAAPTGPPKSVQLSRMPAPAGAPPGQHPPAAGPAGPPGMPLATAGAAGAAYGHPPATRADRPAPPSAAAPINLPAAEATSRPDPVAGLPLALSRFTSTLGPIGRPGVVTDGEEVENLQQVLAHLGYELEHTGEFDEATLQAVQAFQRDRGLANSPTVGGAMRKVLNEMVTG